MKMREFRKKFYIGDWVIDKLDVKVGDRLVWYDTDTEMETYGYVVGYAKSCENSLLVCRDRSSTTEVLNYLATVVIRINKDEVFCSCGAKHTSNPKYHLPYCECSR